MKVVVQRCNQASVQVNGTIVGKIEQGVVLFVGFCHEDQKENVEWMAKKIAGLRIFDDEEGKMNYSLQDVKGKILSISQFTLYGDCRKGNRPNFLQSARPELAKPLYDLFNLELTKKDFQVEKGIFGEEMKILVDNSGPVTLLLER